MKKKIKIYACTHLHPVIFQNEFIKPLQLRKKVTGIELGYLSDDTGDNISSRGVSYGGSLPSIYWVWKNDNESDYVGICHWRRYFLIDEKHNFFQYKYDVPSKEELKKIRFEDNYLCHLFDKYDVILPKKLRTTTSYWKRYSKLMDERDLFALEKAINIVCPEYNPIFNKYFKNGNLLAQYNMLIAKKNVFDDFCEWIFPIIYKIDEMKDPVNNSLSEIRRIDYLSEQLFPLYFIKHKELKIKYLPLIQLNPTEKRVSNFRYILSQIKTELKFRLNI